MIYFGNKIIFEICWDYIIFGVVYGFIDAWSRRILGLFVHVTNHNPWHINLYYLEMICKCGGFPQYLHTDRGTETGDMAATHASLHHFFADLEEVDTTTEWRCHVDVIKPFHFFYDSNSFCSRSESFPRTNPLFLGAMTNMQAVLLDTESSLLIVGFRPCVGDEREEDPLLTNQTLGKLDQKDLPICKSST